MMQSFKSFHLMLALVFFLLFLGAGSAWAAERYIRSVESYSIPDVTLVNQDREEIRLQELLLSDQPVFFDFVYATCTTVCPVLSAGITNMQRKLAKAEISARFVSLTIDPEHDSPEILKKYLERYQARPGWDFLTGSRQDVNEVMRAFDAFVSNKMSHYPIMFIRDPDKKSWVRINGLIGTKEMMAEFKGLYPR